MKANATCPVTLRDRFQRPGGDAFDVEAGLHLECGSRDDYRRLAAFHYKQQPPGAVTAIFRFAHHAPTVVGRYVQRADASTVAAVMTVSLPHPGCKMRDYATDRRYRGLDLTTSMHMLNQEFRTLSRVIVHPQFRGLGLAVRLVRHALAENETIFAEALAAMGRVHPFLEKAGMTRYDQPVRPEHARLLDALATLGVEPVELAAPRSLTKRMESLGETKRQWLERELRIWHRKACMKRSHKVEHPDLEGLFMAARDRLLTRPVYYLWQRDGAETE